MPTSEELNHLAQAVALNGDRQAFAALFKHFAPRVKSYLIRLGTSEGLAEELAQEAMVSVWRKAPSFDPARANVSTWIFTIARNLRVDHFRRIGNRTAEADELDGDDMPDTLPQPDELMLTRQREAGVRAAMGTNRRRCCAFPFTRSNRIRRLQRRWACRSAPSSRACAWPFAICGGCSMDSNHDDDSTSPRRRPAAGPCGRQP
jgi:RNA polymerase sigma factor (sigma-70 family)